MSVPTTEDPSADDTVEAASEQDGKQNPYGMSDMRILVFMVCAMTTMVLSLLDESIVASAVLPIVRDLDPAHGIDRFPWLITAYLLTATAAQPLYGRLSDSFGPRRVYLTSLATFLAGSALCATAGSLTQLIVFRAVQGLGGGGLMSMTLIVIATLYPPKTRAGRSNAGGALVAAGMIAGPMIGGPLSQEVSWRWIFLVNVPVAALALAGVTWALKLPPKHTRQNVDVLGSALLAGATCSLLLAVKAYDHGGYGPWIGWAYTALAMTASFVVRQKKAADPLIPVALFRDRVFRPAAALQFIAGFALLALPVFLINYLNIVRGVDLDTVGLHLIPMALGVVAVFFGWGNWISRTGRCKPVLTVTTATAVVATAGLGLSISDLPMWELDVLLVLLGIGLGGISQIALFMNQSAAAPEQLGVVTTTSRFATMLGTTIGGGLLGVVLSARFASAADGLGVSNPDAAASRIAALPAAGRHRVMDAYAQATGAVLLTAAGLLLLALITALLMPDVDLEHADAAHRDGTEASQAGEADEVGGRNERNEPNERAEEAA
ncbi:MFS transporter [Streptomyces spinosisporus]|uniref:MFS transporter n=1 Tax=Streptomyces spinosisporus TaxID=2927582 RepID=A0ABS9XCF5_9ACTN|nr:MFS transporter [Streptomyces spinosisporus]MCI3239726.1 MFS transporter [Streptomyces spinosisporus]